MGGTASGVKMNAFIDEMRRSAAGRILELGTTDEAFLLAIIQNADWAQSIELHCVDNQSADFDKNLTAAAATTDVDFKLIKHLGSETDICDEILELSETAPFDAVFISNASSKEALLTAFMVCNEVLVSGGVMAVDDKLAKKEVMDDAIATFKSMYGGAYEESGSGFFLKK